MYVKLDDNGKVQFGVHLLKARADVSKIVEFEGKDFVDSHSICCYSEDEASKIASILDAKEIIFEVIDIHWNYNLMESLSASSYNSLADVISQLITITGPTVGEKNISYDYQIELPFTDSMEVKVESVKVIRKDEDGKDSNFLIPITVEFADYKGSLSHSFWFSGEHVIEVTYKSGLKGTLTVEVSLSDDLENYRAKKISDLDKKCNASIQSGFKSSCLGQEYTYDFDYEAQINFAGMIGSINAGIVTTDINWKTKEAGQKVHTKDQFLQLYADGLSYKQQMITRFWGLKISALGATTKDELMMIIW